MQEKTVLVTGGTGFVGSHLCNKIADEYETVIAADLDVSNSVQPLPDAVERRRIDVTDPDTLDMADVDKIVHLVALSPLSTPHGTTHHEIHVEGTENVLAAAHEAGVENIVHMSALGSDPAGGTAYIRAKGQAEQMVKDSETPHSILKPSVIFGEGGEFLNSLVDATAKLPILPLPGGGTTRYQPIHVKDIATIIHRLLETDHSDTYEVGGPDILSMREMAAMAFTKHGKKPRFLAIPLWLVKAGTSIAARLPFLPFDQDQYRAVQRDNILPEGVNDVTKVGMEEKELTTVAAYLGL